MIVINHDINISITISSISKRVILSWHTKMDTNMKEAMEGL